MNRIIIGTFALLGPGAFCASAESPASPAQEGKASTGTDTSLQSVTSGEVAGCDAEDCTVVLSHKEGTEPGEISMSVRVAPGTRSSNAGKADELMVVSQKVQPSAITVEQAGEKLESGDQKSQSFSVKVNPPENAPAGEAKEGEYTVTMPKAGSGDARKAVDEFIVVSRKVQSSVISMEKAGEKVESGDLRSQSFTIRLDPPEHASAGEVKKGEYLITTSKGGSGDAEKVANEFTVVSRKVQSPVLRMEQVGEKMEKGAQKSQSFRAAEGSSSPCGEVIMTVKPSVEVKEGLHTITVKPSAEENVSNVEKVAKEMERTWHDYSTSNICVTPIIWKRPFQQLRNMLWLPMSPKRDRAVVQLALLLDTSSSMDGLINQARTHLWKIVNDMTLGRQNGKLPAIQIALYEYGNSGLSSSENWIRQVLPFTDDLDNVSKKLFELTTRGGTECCGAVIDRAVKDLKWNTDDSNALKMVFIAGNEPFNQGKVAYASAIARGLEKGITVNTIHCGAANDHDTELWRDGARKGDGCFLNIDQNAAKPDPETPFDAELATLSSSLNRTYLAYGSRKARLEKMENQARQDKLAQGLSFEASASRTEAKANKAAYRNTSWDMVDLYEQNGIKALGELKEKGALPVELEGKTEEEMETVVKRKAAERAGIQKKVRELTAQRSEWLNKWKAEQKGAGKSTEESLDDVMIQAVRKQASKKQFSFGGENGKQ